MIEMIIYVLGEEMSLWIFPKKWMIWSDVLSWKKFNDQSHIIELICNYSLP